MEFDVWTSTCISLGGGGNKRTPLRSEKKKKTKVSLLHINAMPSPSVVLLLRYFVVFSDMIRRDICQWLLTASLSSIWYHDGYIKVCRNPPCGIFIDCYAIVT